MWGVLNLVWPTGNFDRDGELGRIGRPVLEAEQKCPHGCRCTNAAEGMLGHSDAGMQTGAGGAQGINSVLYMGNTGF